MDNQDLISAKIIILEAKEEQEIRKIEEKYSSDGNRLSGSGDFLSAIGLIRTEYNGKKELVKTESKLISVTQKKDNGKQSLSQNNIIDWPSEFKWDKEEKKYMLADDKFFIVRGKRKEIFKMIVSKKGAWIAVEDIAEELGKPQKYIRIAANQITNRMKRECRKYLIILPRKILNKPGAYRAVPFLNPC